jgi:uncharacterized membrane protein
LLQRWAQGFGHRETISQSSTFDIRRSSFVTRRSSFVARCLSFVSRLSTRMLLVLSLVPIAFDWGCDVVGIYHNTLWSRSVAGLLTGAGLAFVILPLAFTAFGEILSNRSWSRSLRPVPLAELRNKWNQHSNHSLSRRMTQ